MAKSYDFAKPLTMNAAFDEWHRAMPNAALLDAFRAGIEYFTTVPSMTAPTPDTELVAALEGAMVGVTPGPWQTHNDYTEDGQLTVIANVDGEYIGGTLHSSFDTVAICQDEYGENLPMAKRNAAWIALCSPENIASLIAALKARDAEIERVRAQRDKFFWKVGKRDARIAELEGALRFYANPWDQKDEYGDKIAVPDFYSELDFGSRADAALTPKPQEGGNVG